MSTLLILPPLTLEALAKRTLHRKLELSLDSAAVHQVLIRSWERPSRYAEMPNSELAFLRLVADRAVAITQPSARENAEAAARLALIDAVNAATQTLLDSETHSQRAYILDGMQQLARQLQSSGAWASVMAAYHASLENGR